MRAPAEPPPAAGLAPEAAASLDKPAGARSHATASDVSEATGETQREHCAQHAPRLARPLEQPNHAPTSAAVQLRAGSRQPREHPRLTFVPARSRARAGAGSGDAVEEEEEASSCSDQSAATSSGVGAVVHGYSPRGFPLGARAARGGAAALRTKAPKHQTLRTKRRAGELASSRPSHAERSKRRRLAVGWSSSPPAVAALPALPHSHARRQYAGSQGPGCGGDGESVLEQLAAKMEAVEIGLSPCMLKLLTRVAGDAVEAIRSCLAYYCGVFRCGPETHNLAETHNLQPRRPTAGRPARARSCCHAGSRPPRTERSSRVPLATFPRSLGARSLDRSRRLRKHRASWEAASAANPRSSLRRSRASARDPFAASLCHLHNYPSAPPLPTFAGQ